MPAPVGAVADDDPEPVPPLPLVTPAGPLRPGDATAAAVTTPTSAPAGAPTGYDPRLDAQGGNAPWARLPLGTVPAASGGDTGRWATSSLVRPVRRPPSRVLRNVLLWVAVLGGVAAGARYGWESATGERVPAGASLLLDGGGILYARPDLGYSVRLPANPVDSTTDEDGIAVAGATVEGAGFVVQVLTADVGREIPRDIAADVMRVVVDAALPGDADTLANESAAVHDGFPALDGTVTDVEGRVTRVRAIVAGTRVFVLTVHASTGDGAILDALTRSLHLLARAPSAPEA